MVLRTYDERLGKKWMTRLVRCEKLFARISSADEEGQTLVEFALTVPVLLLVVTGVLFFGVVFFDYLMLTEATQVGARQMMISRGQTLDPCQTLANAVYAAAPNLTQANLVFNVTLNGVNYPSTTSCPGTATTGAPANMVLGTNAVVVVTYPARLTPFSDSIATSFLLTAQTTEQIQ
jgi:Flp pilus assembly protein TadG